MCYDFTEGGDISLLYIPECLDFFKKRKTLCVLAYLVQTTNINFVVHCHSKQFVTKDAVILANVQPKIKPCI